MHIFLKSAIPTKLKHVVPALVKVVPGFGVKLVAPTGQGHGDQGHHKHGLNGLNETLRLLWNDWIQTTDSGLKQHRGNTCWKQKMHKTM